MPELNKANPIEATGQVAGRPLIADAARSEIEDILNTLRQWLQENEQCRADAKAAVGDLPTNAEATPPSLHAMVSEWIALKKEFQLQSRSGQAARTQLDGVVTALEQKSASAVQEAERLLHPILQERDRLRDERHTALEQERRSWFELMFDLREALQRGADACHGLAHGLGWRGMLLRGRMTGAGEGYDLALRRLDDALAAHGVEVFGQCGERFDALRMKAVQVTSNGGVSAGCVAQVLRPGYAHGAQVLRYAEVCVHTEPPTDNNEESTT